MALKRFSERLQKTLFCIFGFLKPFKGFLPSPGCQGRTGPFLVAGLPRYKGISGQLLARLPPADTCQNTTDFVKVSGVPRHGLQPCRVSSSRPGARPGRSHPGRCTFWSFESVAEICVMCLVAAGKSSTYHHCCLRIFWCSISWSMRSLSMKTTVGCWHEHTSSWLPEICTSCTNADTNNLDQ